MPNRKYHINSFGIKPPEVSELIPPSSVLISVLLNPWTSSPRRTSPLLAVPRDYIQEYSFA